MNVEIEQNASEEIARRSRGTPRIVNRLLKRVRDFAQIQGGKITKDIAQAALNALSVDNAGLDKMDRLILSTLVDKFGGRPVGIETIAVAMCEEPDTITDVYEPYLIQLGFIARTPRGRIVTEAGYKHIGKEPPKNLQKELF
jgi:Holliday junction DNA helicase RuvB